MATNNQEREKLIVRQKLLGEGYIRISSKLLATHDPAVSVFITILIGCEQYAENNNYTRGDGWFLCKREYMQSKVKLTPYQQRNITNTLKELGIAEYKLFGKPAKGYFKFNHAKLNKILEQE